MESSPVALGYRGGREGSYMSYSDTVLSLLLTHAYTVTNLILTTALSGNCYYNHFLKTRKQTLVCTQIAMPKSSSVSLLGEESIFPAFITSMINTHQLWP